MVGVTVSMLTFFRKPGVGLRSTVEKNTMADRVDAPIPTNNNIYLIFVYKRALKNLRISPSKWRL